MNNKVLCRPIRNNSELTTKSGIIINYKQAIGQEAVHVNRVFEVVDCPKRFKFHKNKPKMDSLSSFSCPEWRTEIECEIGDIILTNKNGAVNANRIDGLCFIEYTDIYCILRKGNSVEINGEKYDVIVPNGYLICSEIKPDGASDIIITVENDKPIELGKIEYMGRPNMEYWNDKSDDIGDIDVGDVVAKKKSAIHLDLENSMYAFFDGNKKHFMIQRCDIAAKLSEN